MVDEQTSQLEQLKAQRYTVTNKLSSVRTRLKSPKLSEEKAREYRERQLALLTERDRLAAAIEALKRS